LIAGKWLIVSKKAPLCLDPTELAVIAVNTMIFTNPEKPSCLDSSSAVSLIDLGMRFSETVSRLEE
jgi:hypothetical protein